MFWKSRALKRLVILWVAGKSLKNSWKKVYFFVKLQSPALLRTDFFHNLSVRGKRANLKTGVSRKQSTSNFPKNEHFLPTDAQTYVKKYLFFGKFDVLCFLENTRFEISPSALLPTSYLSKHFPIPWEQIFWSNSWSCISMTQYIFLELKLMRYY